MTKLFLTTVIGLAGALIANRALAQAWQYQADAGFTSGEVYSMCEYDPDGSGGIGKKVAALGSFSSSSSGVTGLNGVAAWNGTNWEPMGQGLTTGLSSNSEVLAFDFDGAGPLGTYVVVRSQSSFSVAGQPAGYGAVWNGTSWSRLDLGNGYLCLVVHDPDGSGPEAPMLLAGGSGVWRVTLGGAAVQWASLNAGRLCSFDPDGDGSEPPVLVLASANYGGGMFKWDGVAWSAIPCPFNSVYLGGLIGADLDGDGPLPKQLVSASYDGFTAYVGLHVWSVGLGSVSRFSMPFPGAPWYFSPDSAGGPIGEADLDGVGPGRPALYAVLRVNAYQNDQRCAIGVLDGDGSIVPSQGDLVGVNLRGHNGEQQGPRCFLVFDHDDSHVTPPQMFVGGNVVYTPSGQASSYGVLRRERSAAIPVGKWTYRTQANHYCYLGVDCGVGHSWIPGPVPMPTIGAASDALQYANGALNWNFDMQFNWLPGRFLWHSYDGQLHHGSAFAGWLTPHIELEMSAYSSALPGTRHRRTQRAAASLTGTGDGRFGALTARYNGQVIANANVGTDDGEYNENLASFRSYAAQSLDSIPGVVWTNMGTFGIDLSAHQNGSFPNSPAWVGHWDADGEVSVSVLTGTPPSVQIGGQGSVGGGSGSLTFSAIAEDPDGPPTGIDGFGIVFYEWFLDGLPILAGGDATSVTIPFASPGSRVLTLRVTDDEANTADATRDVGACSVAPAISQSPASVVICAAGTAEFHVVGSGPGLAHRWEFEAANAPGVWSALSDGDVAGFGRVTGATTASLSVGNIQALARGAGLRAVVSNACGTAISNDASLGICGADFNCDSFLDFFDYDEYVLAFETGLPGVDFNFDGFVDFFDYDEYVLAFETGCSAPPTPTNLIAQDTRDTSVTLEWNNGGASSSPFRIYRRSPGGVWQFVQESPAGSAGATVQNLAPSTDVCFKVRAVRPDGIRSDDSAEVCTRTAPARPTNVRATDIGRTSAIIRWTDESIDETGFIIAIRRADNNQLVVQVTGDPNTSSRRVPRAGDVPAQLSPDTLYTVTVRAQRNCCPNAGTSGLGTPGTVQFRTAP